MAKRKATKRKTTGRGAAASRARARRKTSTRKTARKATRKAARKATTARAKASTRKSARKTAARKSRKVSRTATRKTASRPAARKSARKSVRKTAAKKSQKAARTTTARKKTPARKTSRSAAPATRKAPALNRERRTVDNLIETPPSSLDLDRSASAARTGRRELAERYEEHTETGPAITGGDVDADWESAYTVGDEAPGGDNPTPDQDIVEDIGRAVGVQYEDNEELKGEKKVSDRDRKRWELDPASSEDYEDR